MTRSYTYHLALESKLMHATMCQCHFPPSRNHHQTKKRRRRKKNSTYLYIKIKWAKFPFYCSSLKSGRITLFSSMYSYIL
mmetsp:Transcript_11307/g.21223  ORF Transcript_11307/g.21223 Transcript_11307/m.21223 type:complete len:80 (+) Transcript_11307:1474-1713(+)